MPTDANSLVPFKRANARIARVGTTRLWSEFQLHAMAQLGYGMDPRSVPVGALQVMGATCPGVYLAEQTLSGIIRRPDLFSIRHENPKIVAEAEAHLWPLLPRLLSAAARGFSYGTVVCILDWERRTLRYRVPVKPKPAARAYHATHQRALRALFAGDCKEAVMAADGALLRADLAAGARAAFERLRQAAARQLRRDGVLVPSPPRLLRVEGEGEGATRGKTAVNHTHYRQAFETHPDSTTLLLDDQGELAGVDILGTPYAMDRVAAWIWDPEFGDVIGQGARQRAWTPYCRFLIVSLLRDKYLERSVDSPRIAFAPPGKVTIDGVEKEIPEYVVDLLHELQGSGAIGLPGAKDSSGNRLYEVDQLDVPDRSTVWAEAIDRCDGEVFKAYLVPPAMAGSLEEGSGAGARALDGMLREFIENLANFAASGLSRLLAIVHAKNHDPEKIEAPYAVATDVGKAAARKTYLEVIRLANASARGEVSARADLPKLLDALGIPLRKGPFDPFEEEDPSGEEPGRPRKQDGAREERREDATTEEGEDDTGGEDVDREERE